MERHSLASVLGGTILEPELLCSPLEIHLCPPAGMLKAQEWHFSLFIYLRAWKFSQSGMALCSAAWEYIFQEVLSGSLTLLNFTVMPIKTSGPFPSLGTFLHTIAAIQSPPLRQGPISMDQVFTESFVFLAGPPVNE